VPQNNWRHSPDQIGIWNLEFGHGSGEKKNISEEIEPATNSHNSIGSMT